MMQKPMTKKELAGAEVVNQHTGERWVYTDTVKDHFFHPRNLLLKDPEPDEFDAHGVVGSPACLAPETLVRSGNTWFPIMTMYEGKRVVTHKNSDALVNRVYRPQYAGKVCSIRTQLGDIVATPDHLVYSISVPKNEYYRHTKYKKKLPKVWNHAADLEPRDVCIYPIPRRTNFVGEMIIPQERRKWDFKSRSIPPIVRVEEGLLEFFGYFVAEGCTKSTEVMLTFGDKEMHLVKRVRVLVKKYFGLEATIRPRPEQHRIDVSLYNVHLARWMRRLFGRGAAMKQLPAFMLTLPSRLQRGLLKGMWLGDGYINLERKHQRAGYATISPRLIQQIKLLLLRQNIIPSVYTEMAKIVKGVSHRKAYRIHVGDIDSLKRLCDILGIKYRRSVGMRIARWSWIDEQAVYVPVKKVKRLKASASRFYNLEVPGVHTYLTDAFAVHNCGDVMDLWLKIDRAEDKIVDLKWRTFGCGSAIAATSMFSVMVTDNGGMKIDDALKVRPQDIMARLGGLPNRKIHCSVLADKAFQKAVNEYFRASGQHERIKIEGAKLVDKKLNITDKDIEEAVLEGASNLEEVQYKLKVGVGDPESIPEIEQLIRFYKEKYYG